MGYVVRTMQEQIDVSNTVFSGQSPTLINANGTEYLVGEDNHGWITIAHVEILEGMAWPVGDYPYTSFPDKAELLRAIEQA